MIALTLLAALASAQAPDPRPGEVGSPHPLVFEDVFVAVMDREALLSAQAVVVREGRIDLIVNARDFSAPEGALVVPGKGRTLIPGLQDSHVHLIDEGDLFVYLASGVTTVRNLQGNPWHLEVRDRVQSGATLAPRFLTSGPFVNEPRIRTPADVRAEVTAQKEAGYDCIKIHGDLAQETYTALLDAAADAHLPVVGHAPRNLPIERVLDDGRQADISHAEEYLYTYFDRDDIDANGLIAAEIARLTAESGVAVLPNLIAYELVCKQVEDIDAALLAPGMELVAPVVRVTWSKPYNKYEQDFDPSDAPRLWRRYGFLQRFTKALSEAGVRLLAGSDANNPTAIPGLSLHQELAALVASGLSPYRALRSATIDAGEFLYGADGPGSIALGRPADLVLIAGDPLVDPFAVTRVEGVVIRGRWLSGEELASRRRDLVQRYTTEATFMSRITIATPAAALEYHAEARRSEPDVQLVRPEGFEALTMLFLLVQNAGAALEVAELYVQEFPDSWRSYARMAEAQAALGEREYARESYAQALELNPENRRLRAVLEDL